MLIKILFAVAASIATCSASAVTVSGSCASDGALAQRMAQLRDTGKSQDVALATLGKAQDDAAKKLARLLWENSELRTMSPVAVGKLTIEKCKEVVPSTPKPSSVPPLSCNMKSQLAYVAALMRDAGQTRAEVSTLFARPDSELTKQEAKAILDVSFGGMKTVASSVTCSAPCVASAVTPGTQAQPLTCSSV